MAGTTITLKNQCAYGVKAFARHGASPTNSYQLTAKTGSQRLDVGSSFPAGLIWGSASGNADNAQVSLASNAGEKQPVASCLRHSGLSLSQSCCVTYRQQAVLAMNWAALTMLFQQSNIFQYCAVR